MSTVQLPGGGQWRELIAPFAHVIDDTERPLVAGWFDRFQTATSDFQLGHVIVTPNRLMASKYKTFGKRKVDFSIELSEIASTGFGPLRGVGPTWEAHFKTVQNDLVIMYFDPDDAEVFSEVLTEAVRRTAEPQSQQPKAEPATSMNSTADPDFEPKLIAFANGLVDFVGEKSIGRPFGPAVGLEAAMESARRELGNTAAVRAAGRRFAAELLLADDPELPKIVPQIMGCQEEILRSAKLPPPIEKDVAELAGAAQRFLNEFEGSGSLWDLWNSNDDVAIEFLCWHSVARLRLATVGRMPSFGS